MQYPFLDIVRLGPSDQPCPKLSRMPFTQTVTEVKSLLQACFVNALDGRGNKAILFIEQLRLSNGAEAARLFVELDGTTRFFVRFALEMYGLDLRQLRFKSIAAS